MVTSLTQNQITRDNVSSEPEEQPVIITWFERIGVELEPLQVTQETIGNSWIVGSSTNGIVGTNTGTQGGGQQVVGGSGKVETVQKVLNVNNIVRMKFNSTTLNDSGSTTATWSGNGEISFTNTEIAQSLSLYLDSATITFATLDIDDDTNLTLELSANGGTNWESVTNGVKHSFTNTGTDLRFKFTATGNATIKTLRIKYG